MMPLLSIQVLGFVFGRKKTAEISSAYSDEDIVELWEVPV